MSMHTPCHPCSAPFHAFSHRSTPVPPRSIPFHYRSTPLPVPSSSNRLRARARKVVGCAFPTFLYLVFAGLSNRATRWQVFDRYADHPEGLTMTRVGPLLEAFGVTLSSFETTELVYGLVQQKEELAGGTFHKSGDILAGHAIVVDFGLFMELLFRGLPDSDRASDLLDTWK
eukprot:gene7257-6842_t